MKFEIETDLTSEDYATYNKHLFNKGKLKKYILFSVIMSLVLPYIITDYKQPRLSEFIISFIVFNSIFIGYLYYRLGKTKNIPMRDGTTLGKRKYILQDNEFICEKANAESKIKWSGIKSMDVTSKAIYLFVDTNQAFIIPKRSFADIQAQNEFLETVNRKIKDSNVNG